MLLGAVIFLLAFAGCTKDENDGNDENDRFELLTTPVWGTDSLLVNGVDAGGSGQLLVKFKGNAKFNTDGTGTFGSYSGTWRFPDNTRKNLVISTDSLPIPIYANIVELTASSLKLTTELPDLTGQTDKFRIRMTFKAK